MKNVTKAELLLGEIIHGLVCSYNLSTIEYAIAMNFKVEQNTDVLDKFFKLDVLEINSIITLKINVRFNEDDNWIMSPTLQFSYKLDDNDFTDITIHKGEDKMISFINYVIERFNINSSNVETYTTVV